MTIEQKVSQHYTHGSLETAILEALAKSGKDIERLAVADLMHADEFHLGWRAATVEIGKALKLTPQMRLLDVGSGIGGPARYFGETSGCRVAGIDLTEEFVTVANSLTRRVGLSDRVTFKQASALSLPFNKAEFDAATLIHVGMNIADKAQLFSEVRRVLKTGAVFGVYEVMRTGEAELPYPMPWAMTPETSFVETPDTYKRLLTAAGFTIESETNRRDMVLELAAQMREDVARNGAPPVSLSLLMGPSGRERLANVMSTLQAGTIAPVQIIARA
ncbi:class I SAM-dependent methyltransferase [soil metagenome]